MNKKSVLYVRESKTICYIHKLLARVIQGYWPFLTNTIQKVSFLIQKYNGILTILSDKGIRCNPYDENLKMPKRLKAVLGIIMGEQSRFLCGKKSRFLLHQL